MRPTDNRISWDDFQGVVRADKRLRWRLRLSGAALLWEEFWKAAWPLFSLVGLFIAVSLFGVWNWLSGWPHLIALLCFFCAFVWSAVSIPRSVRLPNLASCIGRLERNGNQTHRPITSLIDKPATPLDDHIGRQLWELHLGRVSAATRLLRVAWPTAGIVQRDRFGVRAALFLLVVVGLVFAGESAPNRLAAAMDLRLAIFAPAEPGTLTAWLTPPDYTGLAPVFLTDRLDRDGSGKVIGPLVVAEGSRLVARVHGGDVEPSLKATNVDADVVSPTERSIPFQSIDETNYSVEQEILHTGGIKIVQDHVVLGEWEIEVILDQAPTVAFSEIPQETHKEVLRFGYQAEDDYGVARIAAHINRADDELETLSLRVPGGVPKSLDETSYQDLTPHPWAGMPVTIKLVVHDVLGQTGESRWIDLVLPVRAFNHPVAKAIVEQRRQLALDLSTQQMVQKALDDISQHPEEFGDDVVTYMSLRTAVTRLSLNVDNKTPADVIDLLWEVALRIEDGTLSIAERDLRASEEALRDALDRNASNEEILELTRELQQNLDRFLGLLQSQIDQEEQGPFGDSEQAAFDPGSDLPEEVDHPGNRSGAQTDNQRNRRDLEEMVEKTRDLALTGSREAAQSMLNELQETLENLRRGKREESPDMESGRKREIDALQDVTEDQDALLNETFEQLRGDKGNKAASPEQSESQRTPGEVVQDPASVRETPPLRGDEIERMDDLGEGDQSPTAARQNNSVEQTEGPPTGREDLSNDTQTRGDPSGGDQTAAAPPQARDGQQQEQSSRNMSVAPAQAARGGEGAEGETPQTGTGRFARQHGDNPPQSKSQRQEELRQKLGDVMRDLGESGSDIPAELGKAERFMREASEALDRDRPDRAVRSQTEALNQLRQGVATLRGQRTNIISDDEQAEEPTSQRPDDQRDPFGRRPPGKAGDPTGYVEIPEASDIQRSRNILDELYRRAGDVHRPEPERLYIERLLRWY